MNKKTIDILMPTYNGEKYLKEQLDSILNQTYTNIRIIISDDCSKDSTPEILKQYAKQNDKVEIYLQKENLGVVKNIEFLLQKVENEIFMLADQDDVWLDEKIEKTLEALEKKDADLAFGDLEVVDKDLKTIYPSFNDYMLLTRKINKYVNSNSPYKLEYLYNCITGCTLMAKKKLINDIIPLPGTSKYLIHDHWIGIMAATKGKLAYVPEKYIKYRQHGNNQVGTDKISHKFKKLDQVRNLFIEVKLGVFGTYAKNNKRFPDVLKQLNEEAYKYYKMLNQKKNFNFKGWKTFHKLYKTETFMYYIKNFIILNMPAIARLIFVVRHGLLKILGKR